MILLGAATIYLFPEPLPSSSVTPRSDAVPRSENLHVMPFVAGNHVRDRPYAHRLAARGAAPSPSNVRNRARVAARAVRSSPTRSVSERVSNLATGTYAFSSNPGSGVVSPR